VRKLLNDEAREGPGSVGGENWGTRLSKTTLRSGGGFFNRNSFGAALARNLHALGADDLTIQRILRHSNVAVRSESATSRRCLSKALPGCAAWKLRSTRCRGCNDLTCALCALDMPQVTDNTTIISTEFSYLK